MLKNNHISEETRKLYPDRIYVVDKEKMSIIKMLSEDLEHNEVVSLSEQEKENIDLFESDLSKRLEKIYEITPKSSKICLEYYLDDFGATNGMPYTDQVKVIPEKVKNFKMQSKISPRKELQELLGVETIPTHNLKEFLISHIDTINKIESKKRVDQFSKSIAYVSTVAEIQLESSMDEEGHLHADENFYVPTSFTLDLSPGEREKKINEYRVFKKELKQLYRGLKEDNDENKAKKIILNLYAKRVNELIASELPNLGEQNELATKLRREMQVARYDKFLYGAERNEDGTYNQIPRVLREERVKILSEIRVKNLKQRNEIMLDRQLDPNKIFEENITPDEAADFAEEILKEYGLLSRESRSTYDPDRKGPASDGLWQAIVNPKAKNMSVLPKKQIISIPSKSNFSIYKIICVLLAHEVEGHVLQNINKRKVDLKLFDKIGGDRKTVFAEAGAKFNEGYISEKIFGFADPAQPHYIRAMKERLRGGSLQDCIIAFHESALEEIKSSIDLHTEDNRRLLRQKSKALIPLAVSRTFRLFRGGDDLEISTNLVRETKSASYVEQELLMDELKAYNLTELAFVGGCNIDTVYDLFRLGKIQMKDIEKPKYYVEKIWDKVKDKYRLETSKEDWKPLINNTSAEEEE